MDCKFCGTEMESKGASGHQRKGGAKVAVDVSWDECPDCGAVKTPEGEWREA